MTIFSLFLRRDLRLLLRNSNQIAQPIALFFMIAVLFPFSLPADAVQPNGLLSTMGAAIIWVAALLSIMLSLESMYSQDYHDGAIEQWLVGQLPISTICIAKVVANFLTSGLLVILLAPVIGLMYGIATKQIGILMLTLALGTPSILLIGSIASALTVTITRGGLLITIIVLPLALPVLIFAASSLHSVAVGSTPVTELYALAAILTLCLTLAPIATSAALKLTVD